MHTLCYADAGLPREIIRKPGEERASEPPNQLMRTHLHTYDGAGGYCANSIQHANCRGSGGRSPRKFMHIKEMQSSSILI